MKKIISLAVVLTVFTAVLSGCLGGAQSEYIGADKAKSIALKNAGIAEEGVLNLEVELDRERMTVVYEVSFDADGYEYDYDIDALSGEIVRTHKELDDNIRLPSATDFDGTLNTESVPDVTDPPATEPIQLTLPTTVVDMPDQNYISVDRAKEIALEHAGLSESDVWDLKVELDRERGVTVYDVGFDAQDYDYDYEIDAVTGDILRSDKERENNMRPSQVTTSAATDEYIGAEEAKRIALEDSGLSENDIWDLEVELDRENGVLTYDVSFETDGYDYDYEIDALSGKILWEDKDRDNNNVRPSQSDAAGYISSDRAMEIALEHAGLTADGVRKLQAELDREHGGVVYEVSFEAGGYEYDYEIDAVTGEILKSEKERD